MQGWTPLHGAADNFHPGVVKLLLKSCTQEALDAASVQVLIMYFPDPCFMAYHLWVGNASRLPLSFICTKG